MLILLPTRRPTPPPLHPTVSILYALSLDVHPFNPVQILRLNSEVVLTATIIKGPLPQAVDAPVGTDTVFLLHHVPPKVFIDALRLTLTAANTNVTH